MAILLVKVENKESLPLNEFFDYNGYCYGISKSRDSQGDTGIELYDFFEATAKTTELKGITVVFILEDGNDHIIKGWYKNATVSKAIKRPSLFLEGNLVAASSDVVLLPDSNVINKIQFREKRKNYEVIENEDERYGRLTSFIDNYSGDNAFVRYPYADAKLIPSATKSVEACNEACEFYASRILGNSCKGIIEIKMLEKYAERLTQMDPKSADGYYYLAMAQCQLGFSKKGIKAIEKALKLEPEASDIIAQKGILLCSMSYDLAASECFDEAFNKSHDEQYLLLKGQALLRAGEIDKGYETLKKIEDPSILEESGIRMNSKLAQLLSKAFGGF